ncbi:glycosyltransferase family 2 protein [Hymenobacter psoromatis]|uniref:glycosyltransferase family 2 protein n=1 Tax=Hymenobacter psoromatis TaxID=1484116 RepID=UPI001CBD7507|nr:glycosyltransferase [Hymenobacter psoromatis]
MSKVSIVITTYKRPELVVGAITSCLEQTVLPYEILVGDDSPDTRTAEVVHELAAKAQVPIRYLHNVPSLKQARNVNRLFEEAAGDKIMLLHDDDLLLPESVETLSRVFEENPTVDMAYGRQYIISEQGEIDPVSSTAFNEDFYRTAEFEGSVLTAFEAGLGQQIPNNGYMLKAEIAKQLMWRTDIGDGCEYDFGIRLGLAGYRTYFVNKYVGIYRLSAQSISGSGGSDMARQAFKIMRDSVADTPRAQSIKNRRLYERAPIAITECVRHGEKKEALAIFFSKWYRSRILSLRGMKRMLNILFYPNLPKILR